LKEGITSVTLWVKRWTRLQSREVLPGLMQIQMFYPAMQGKMTLLLMMLRMLPVQMIPAMQGSN
tara:strand:+ start:358 stop:549 length:192 start_codon:yes stop_codon:yes gene_type:complete